MRRLPSCGPAPESAPRRPPAPRWNAARSTGPRRGAGGEASVGFETFGDYLRSPDEIPYPNETPLEDVLAYLARADARPSDDRGIRFIVVPNGLKEAGRRLQAMHRTWNIRAGQPC